MKNSPDQNAFETIIDNVRRLFDNFVGMFRRQPQDASTDVPQNLLPNLSGNTSSRNVDLMRREVYVCCWNAVS